MKIVQIITQHEGGGAQSRAIKMMHHLKTKGYDVKTVFLYFKRPAFQESQDIINLWPHRPKIHQLPSLFYSLWKYLKNEKATIVMPYTHWANVLVAPIAYIAGVKHVLANQTQVPDRIPALARKLDALIGATKLYSISVCNSKTTEKAIKSYVSKTYSQKLRTVTLGVDVPKPTLNKEQLRKKYNLPNGTVLLHVGRLSHQKNHANLLHALAKIPEVTLCCVGDGELKENLHALSQSLGLQGRVLWLGERPAQEVSELLYAADLFVFPSLWEGFGLAPIEACAAGLPLVAADIPTFREIMKLDDGSYAPIFVDPQSPDAIAQGIKEALIPENLMHLQKRCTELGKVYSLERMTNDYIKLFNENQ
jgi:glycosyltransferase involved in cell wall biosynthesis